MVQIGYLHGGLFLGLPWFTTLPIGTLISIELNRQTTIIPGNMREKNGTRAPNSEPIRNINEGNSSHETIHRMLKTCSNSPPTNKNHIAAHSPHAGIHLNSRLHQFCLLFQALLHHEIIESIRFTLKCLNYSG